MMTELSASFTTCTGLKVDVDFKDNINILHSDSGTGKTYLIHLLKGYCYGNDIPYCDFNSSAMQLKEESIIISLQDKDIVFFDNADLYLTNRILDECRRLGVLVIASLKDVTTCHVAKDGWYFVEFSSDLLTVERIK